MSIIYDALKKVEKTAVVQNGSTPRKKADYKIYFLYLGIAGLGIMAANLIFNFTSGFLKPPAAPKITEPLPRLPQLPQQPAAIEPPLAQEPVEPPQFVLNGIFFSEGQGYALINNQILRQGDVVSGATVTAVSANEVELTFQGSKIKLALELR